MSITTDPAAAAPTSGKPKAILDAALALFADRGFHGTPVPLIAETAHVGVGTIYRHFTTKEGLVNVLFRRERAALLDSLRDGFPYESPAREQFHSLWSRLLQFAADFPASLRFLELHYHQPYLDRESRVVAGEAVQWVLELFEREEWHETAKPVPHVLIPIVWGACVSLVKASWARELELTEDVCRQAEECCWDAVRR